MTRSWLERTHGAAINFKALKSCGRALYARSAFNAPPQSIPGPYRRVHGPWWLLTYCDAGGSPAVSVAVSAWATELTMQAGKLHFPRISGTEIVAVGIPLGHVGEFPMSPEAAVALGAQQMGRRVSKVPELITPLSSEGPPQFARWHLTLEAPTTVRTSSGARAINDVFVSQTVVGGSDVVTLAPASEQPTSVDLDWAPVPVIGELNSAYVTRVKTQTTKITRRADTPVRVEPITGLRN